MTLDHSEGFGGDIGEHSADEENGRGWVDGLISAAVDGDAGRRRATKPGGEDDELWRL